MKVAFTGHREYDRERYDEALERRIVELCAEAAERQEEVIFLSGMAVGFDMAAAEVISRLREGGELTNARLHAIVPYAMQAEFYSAADITRYQQLLDKADHIVVLEEEYSRTVFFKRNDYLVENAELLIAYFDGENKGGTAYTVRKARKAQLPTENLFQMPQLTLF